MDMVVKKLCVQSSFSLLDLYTGSCVLWFYTLTLPKLPSVTAFSTENYYTSDLYTVSSLNLSYSNMMHNYVKIKTAVVGC